MEISNKAFLEVACRLLEQEVEREEKAARQAMEAIPKAEPPVQFAQRAVIEEKPNPVKKASKTAYRLMRPDGGERGRKTVAGTFNEEEYSPMRDFLSNYGETMGVFNNVGYVVRMLLLYFKDNHRTIDLSKYKGK